MEKIKYIPKPGDAVLGRDGSAESWSFDFFVRKDKSVEYYECIGHFWNEIIPFKGNERLANTTCEPDDIATSLDLEHIVGQYVVMERNLGPIIGQVSRVDIPSRTIVLNGCFLYPEITIVLGNETFNMDHFSDIRLALPLERALFLKMVNGR